MTVSTEEFQKRVLESGVLSAEAVRAALETLPEASRPKDGEQLARELVRRKLLTPFQASMLYQGKGKSLVFGNYLVLDKLGQGGMGMVLKAVHRRMERVVALKVVNPQFVKSGDSLARFQREVRAAARLSHPNVVAAFDADVSGGMHYLVMEYVDGTDLGNHIRQHGPLPLDKAANCILQAARGLDYAHRQGVIHRDVKPSNLLLDRAGTVKVLDLGLARLSADDPGKVAAPSDLTGTGVVMGTIDYMSPEQAVDTRHADARSDVYSLGCTLFTLTTGRPVYEGDTVVKRLLAHRENRIPSLRESLECRAASGGVSPDRLDAILHRMLAKRPERRYQTMAEVVEELTRFVAGEAVSAVLPSAHPVDDYFTAFLQRVADATERADSPQTSRASDGASATAHTVAAGERFDLLGDATLMSSAPHSDTDPSTHTQFSQMAAEARKAPPGRPNSNPRSNSIRLKRRVAIGAGAVATCLVLAVLGSIAWHGDGPLSTSGASGDRKPDQGVIAATTSEGDKLSPGVDAGWQLAFDGVNDYVEVADLKLEDPDGPLTIEAWVTPQSSKTANVMTWLGPKWLVLFQMDGGWGIGRMSGERSQVQWARNTLRIGRRTHLAGVWTKDELRLAVDGEFATLIPVDFRAGATEGGLFLGGVPADRLGHERYFAGEIDEVRISSTVRYPSDFKPGFPLRADLDTRASFAISEGSGAETLGLGNKRGSGRIHGAQWLERGRRKSAGSTEEIPRLGDREATEWVVANGGTAGVRLDGTPLTFAPKTRLPAGRLELLSVEFKNPSSTVIGKLPSLSGLTQLARIQAASPYNTSKTLEGLDDLPLLQELNLSGGPVNDRGLEALSRHEMLRHISLNATSVTDDGIAALASLGNLRFLDLRGSQVTGAGLAALPAESGLEILWLGPRGGVSIDLSAAARFRHLHTIYLDPADDSALPYLAEIPSLRALSLSKGQLTNAKLLEHLPKLKQVKNISVDHWEPTAAVVAEIEKALPDCKMVWYRQAKAP